MRIIVLFCYLVLFVLCTFAWIAEARMEKHLGPHPLALPARSAVEEIDSLDRAKDLLGRSLDGYLVLQTGMQARTRAYRGLIVLTLVLALPGVLYAFRGSSARREIPQRDC